MQTKMILKCAKCALVMEVQVPCDCGPDCAILCCGEAMQVMEAKTADRTVEKHVPVPAPEQPAEGSKIVVGSIPHPMTPEHHIVWIEIIDGATVSRKYLNPTDSAEAQFCVKLKKGMVLREYCNIHGLWTGTVE